MTRTQQTITHYGCEYSFHKDCLDNWYLESKPHKCVQCQESLKERTLDAETAKFLKIIRSLRVALKFSLEDAAERGEEALGVPRNHLYVSNLKLLILALEDKVITGLQDGTMAPFVAIEVGRQVLSTQADGGNGENYGIGIVLGVAIGTSVR